MKYGSTGEDVMVRPLEGLRVLDCSLGTAGPQASGILADYGADVIWVEPPGGDQTRRREPASAAVFNRGKRSVVLDVREREDRERIAQLAERSDVFIQSWGAEGADALGLGFQDLRSRNVQIVYCSISGFGAEDSRRNLPAYEGLIHALVGTMAYQAGHREGPIYQGLPFASTGAAQLAVIGILAALHRRLEDGAPRHVETSLFDGALAFHQMIWGESDATLKTASHEGTRATLKRSRNRLVTRSFLCSDGQYLGVHTGALGAFSRLMSLLGLDDRIKPITSGFDMGTPLTQEESDLLESTIHCVFAAHPRDEWVKRMIEADICAVEHMAPTAVFDDPQARHNAMVLKVDDPSLGPIEQVAPGVRFDGRPPQTPKPAPEIGRDTVSVLAALERPLSPSTWAPAAAARADERPLLAGVNVIDFGAYYAGPYSSRVLADLGADVIKLEPTAGDQLRGNERPYFSASAGKRSLAANLKSAALRPAIETLVRWADVIHHNLRPGAAERLGMGGDQIRAINPDTIYLYAPGWGPSGPFMKRQSFAPMLAGYVGASAEVAGEFNEPMPSIGNEDPGNGLLGAIAMLVALADRRRTGRVLACESPQLNAAMGLMAHVVRTGDGTAVGAGRLDVLQTGVEALESLFETADGWVCLAAREDVEICALESMLNLSILADARFDSIEQRRTNRYELTELLRPAFAAKATGDLIENARQHGVPLVEPENESIVHRLLNDPEQRRLGRVVETLHPEKGAVREFTGLVRISGSIIQRHRLAPGLGEHTAEILGSVGYSSEQIDDLSSRGEVHVMQVYAR